ncbi:MAG: glycerol-3-phosphate ABC transporter substrate-binding protein, partial [Castellaniella sp.]
DLVAPYAQKSAVTAQGFRINNYPAIRSRFQQIIDTALDGQEPAVTALSTAAAEGNRLVRQAE